jgi:hypothetical protein
LKVKIIHLFSLGNFISPAAISQSPLHQRTFLALDEKPHNHTQRIKPGAAVDKNP